MKLVWHTITLPSSQLRFSSPTWGSTGGGSMAGKGDEEAWGGGVGVAGGGKGRHGHRSHPCPQLPAAAPASLLRAGRPSCPQAAGSLTWAETCAHPAAGRPGACINSAPAHPCLARCTLIQQSPSGTCSPRWEVWMKLLQEGKGKGGVRG